MSATALRARLRLPHPSIVAAIAGAWGLALWAQASGRGGAVHHDALIEGGPAWASLALFVVAWQAMIAAMMLPSSLPLVVLFERAARTQPRPAAARAAFLGGYAAVWTAFGVAALAGDLLVHRAVHAWGWLGARPHLVGAAALGLAGAFQFSALKEKCLRECRNPGAYMLKHYRRGVGEAFRFGAGHGLFCLGCCWAMMLVAFAAGVANLWWMAAFTAVMVFEKTGPGGERGARPIGAGLVALGALAATGWLPALVG